MVKSQNALKKIAEDGSGLLINNQIAEEEDIYKKIEMFAYGYVAKRKGKKQGDSTYGVMRRDLSTVSQMISNAQKLHTDNLVSEVKENLDSVVGALDEGYLAKMASRFIGKNYAELERAIQQGGDVRGMYSNIFPDDPLWKSLVASAIPEAVSGAAGSWVEEERREETIRNLYSESGRFDVKKSQAYVKENIRLDENKDPLYVDLGTLYTRMVIDKAQSKRQSKK